MDFKSLSAVCSSRSQSRPLQQGGSECGVFACAAMEDIVGKVMSFKPTLTNGDVPLYRTRLAREFYAHRVIDIQ